MRLKRGDRAALDAIYRAYAEVLFRYGYKFTKDQVVIEDCIHDLFVYIWKNRDGVSDTDNIRRYLMAAFRNRIIKEIKKTQKLINNPDTDYFDGELSVEERIIDEESAKIRSGRLRAAIATLSAREQEALYLKFYNQMPSEDICEVMGISYQSFRNVLYSGIKKLRKKIKK